jgi:hypothetical protein
VFRRAIQQAGIRGGNREPAGREPVTARAEAARHSATAPDLRRPDDRPMRQDEPPPRREQGYRAPPPDDRYRAPPAADDRHRAPPAEDRYHAPPPPSSDLYEPEPRLAPEYDQDWESAPAPATGRGSAPPPPQLDQRDRLAFAKKGRRRGYLEEDDAELLDKPARRSRLPGLILLVLIVGVVGGLAALGWSQRAVLDDLLASFESNAPPTLSEQTSDAAEPASTKNADRLPDGNNAQPQPAAAAAPDVRVVGDQGGGDTQMAAAAASGDAGAEPLPVSAGDAGSATPSPQKAILYEEPTDSSNGGVTAINAAVTWQYNKDGPNGPEIEASLEVPERAMTVRFSLHKNSDDTLPASHLIEVTVDTPADFPGKGIDEIPRIVFKPTEEARGQPLVGAAAKVADGFFWIALSANQNDIASNLDLLRGREWIDLPFVYGNGQRAILTFEKGPQGDHVFAEALAAWGAS